MSAITALTTSSSHQQARRHGLQLPRRNRRMRSHHRKLHHQAEEQRQFIERYSQARQHAAAASGRQVGQAKGENSRGTGSDPSGSTRQGVQSCWMQHNTFLHYLKDDLCARESARVGPPFLMEHGIKTSLCAEVMRAHSRTQEGRSCSVNHTGPPPVQDRTRSFPLEVARHAKVGMRMDLYCLFRQEAKAKAVQPRTRTAPQDVACRGHLSSRESPLCAVEHKPCQPYVKSVAGTIHQEGILNTLPQQEAKCQAQIFQLRAQTAQVVAHLGCNEEKNSQAEVFARISSSKSQGILRR